MSEAGKNTEMGLQKDINAFARVFTRAKEFAEWLRKNALILFAVGFMTGGAGGSSCSNLTNRWSKSAAVEAEKTNHRVDSALTLLTAMAADVALTKTTVVALKGTVDRMPGGKKAYERFEKDKKKAMDEFGLTEGPKISLNRHQQGERNGTP